jgi:hypothetical protein
MQTRSFGGDCEHAVVAAVARCLSSPPARACHSDPDEARRGQYILSSPWHAWLKACSGSENPWLTDCLIPENVLFSLA